MMPRRPLPSVKLGGGGLAFCKLGWLIHSMIATFSKAVIQTGAVILHISGEKCPHSGKAQTQQRLWIIWKQYTSTVGAPAFHSRKLAAVINNIHQRGRGMLGRVGGVSICRTIPEKRFSGAPPAGPKRLFYTARLWSKFERKRRRPDCWVCFHVTLFIW